MTFNLALSHEDLTQLPLSLTPERITEICARTLDVLIQKNLRAPSQKPIEIQLALLTPLEIQALNKTYRGKDKPTNVLSFESDPDMPQPQDILMLGDIALCPELLQQEACAQQKTLEAHYTHLLIHGVLHLCGFDHETDIDAKIMEPLETHILHSLGFEDPYAIEP